MEIGTIPWKERGSTEERKERDGGFSSSREAKIIRLANDRNSKELTGACTSGGACVGGFRRIYGGNKRNGRRPRHFCKSSGYVARHVLQQLEQISIVVIDPKGKVTSSGQRDLDQVAGRIGAAV